MEEPVQAATSCNRRLFLAGLAAVAAAPVVKVIPLLEEPTEFVVVGPSGWSVVMPTPMPPGWLIQVIERYDADLYQTTVAEQMLDVFEKSNMAFRAAIREHLVDTDTTVKL